MLVIYKQTRFCVSELWIHMFNSQTSETQIIIINKSFDKVGCDFHHCN